MYTIWLDLDARSALNTGTPSVEAHWGAVYFYSLIAIVTIFCAINDTFHCQECLMNEKRKLRVGR